jgi:hypothetical protein
VKRSKRLCISVRLPGGGSWTDVMRRESSFSIAFVATSLVEVLKSKCETLLTRWEPTEREVMDCKSRRLSLNSIRFRDQLGGSLCDPHLLFDYNESGEDLNDHLLATGRQVFSCGIPCQSTRILSYRAHDPRIPTTTPTYGYMSQRRFFLHLHLQGSPPTFRQRYLTAMSTSPPFLPSKLPTSTTAIGRRLTSSRLGSLFPT